MGVAQAIPFAVGALVLLWAAASGAMAFSGGESSGLHHVAPPPAPAPTAEQRALLGARRAQRRDAVGRVLNYALACTVLGATVAMIVGMLAV